MTKYIVINENTNNEIQTFWKDISKISLDIQSELKSELIILNSNDLKLNLSINSMQGILNEITRSTLLESPTILGMRWIFKNSLFIIKNYFDLISQSPQHIQNYIIIKDNGISLNYTQSHLNNFLTLNISSIQNKLPQSITFNDYYDFFNNSNAHIQLSEFYRFLSQDNITCFHEINNIEYDFKAPLGNSLKIVLQSFVRSYIEVWGCNII